MEALIVVDMQNDFLKGGALAVPHGNSIIPVINNLIEKFDYIVYTKDWHPENHKSFASSHEGKDVGDMVLLGDIQQYLWPEHCIQNEKGSEFHTDLLLAPESVIFYKGVNQEIDSYSAFYDNEKLNSTGLTEHLKEKNISKVYICGLAADYCVKFSVLDALADGFETVLFTDATKAVNVDPGDYEKAIEEMKSAGAILLTSKEIL